MALFSSSPFTAGQFYDRTVTIAPYSGPLDLNSNYYSVTVPGRGGEPGREFFARLYHLDWSHQEKLCLYAGNNQGGAKESEQTDSVITGSYQEYAVDGILSEAGQFGIFNSESCGP